MPNRKNQPITYRLFIGDKQVTEVPEELKEKNRQRVASAVTRYLKEHPEAIKSLEGKPYVKIYRGEEMRALR